MGRLIKLADVAKAAGVSQGTASNVFNRPALVRLEIREKVEAVARDLGYTGPDPKGRLLRAGKVHAIGLVVPERLAVALSDPFDRMFLTGIAEVCDERGAGLSLISAYEDEGPAAWTMQTALVDGFVLLCLEEGARLVELARKRQLPFVAVDSDSGPGASSIRIDDRGAAREAAEHLTKLGHRQFVILSLELSPDGQFGRVNPVRREAARYSVTRERLTGYGEALAAAGVDIDGLPVFEVLNRRSEARAVTAGILERAPETTAILAMSDELALGALDAAQEAGVSVPGDLSIVGFDDVVESARSDPPLTTVRQPILAKGRRASEIILDGGPPVHEVLPTELVIRGSTGPARR